MYFMIHDMSFSYFFDISKLHVSFASFFKLLQISPKFSTMFIEKNLCISRLVQFKPMLFKGPTIYII